MPPTILLDSLKSVRRRVRTLSLLYGLGVLLAAGVGLLLATVLVDYLLNLPTIPRLAVIIVAACAFGYVLARWLVRPMMAQLSLSDVAGRLEHAFPEFDDRLRSTVDFVDSDVPGSEMMKDRVVTETIALAQRLDLNRAVVAAPAWRSMGLGLGAIVLMIALSLLVSDQYLRIALSRLFTPFDSQPWPKRVQIDLVGDMPRRVPVGQRVDLTMRLSRGDKASQRATIFYQYGDGRVQQELMTRGEDGLYHASIDAKAGAVGAGGAAAGNVLKVRIAAGDDVRVIDPITVVPRLEIARVGVTITPPAYAAHPPETRDLTQGPAVMTAGSQVALSVTFNKGLDAAVPVELLPISEEMKSPAAAQWTAPDGSTAVGTWTAQDSLRFHIRATDTDGFHNSGLEEYELIVRPDQNPTVQIENPRRNEERTPVAVIPLQAVADDDFGIQSMTLVVERLGDKKKWEIPLVEAAQPGGNVTWTRIEGTGDRRRFRMNHTWDLAALPEAALKPGDVLEYHVLVQDNYRLQQNNETLTHAAVPSGKLRIAIISQEEFANRITDELRTVSNQVNEIRNTQNRTKEETQSLAKETEGKDALDKADRAAAERLANQQSTAASQAKQVATKLDGIRARMEENKSPNQELKDIATDVKTQLDQTAENPMKDAAGQITQAKDRQSDAKQRTETFNKAVENQQKAADDLQKALDRMGNIGSLQQSIARIRDILEQQRRISKEMAELSKRNLGKKPEDMKPEDRDKLGKLSQEQQDLAERTNKALDEMGKISNQMSRSDPASAEAMKNAADTGKQQQVAPNQQKAAESAKKNQQSQTQAAQKQAELGLEMMINRLREAERRKLEELSKKLTELEQQVMNLIRRQAGHNLDNLSIQGPDRVAKLEAKELSDLLANAQRDIKALPPVPELRQLGSAQEQTERNARDIAKKTEEIPNGTEPAAHLTRAAGRMERAIVELREKKLVEAYEPPQREALAALQDALKIIHDQKKAADEQLQQQEKEAIRQVYIKIKEDQEKLNAETARIDKSPRLPDGALKREDAVRLGQLPGEQGGLSDRTQKLEEALVAVGGIVYVWANKDIVGSMNDVKDDLGKPATGVPTQAEQLRIVEQLDAMIRNLAIKPKEQNFEDRNNGGGGAGAGGQGSAKLPTEAEIRLLQDLQRAINKSTKTIDAQPDKDKEKLVALGGRQGELRGVLDELLRTASQGQLTLGPEPDKTEQLPEEADEQQVENQELDQELLNDQAAVDDKVVKDMGLIGDRMARSRQRLALNNDPGKTTQIIQERILQNLDELAESARNQQSQASANPKTGQGQQQQKPAEDPAQANNQGKPSPPKPNTGQTAAQDSQLSQGGDPNADLSQEIKENMTEWGATSPRLRDAVIEGGDETIIEKYKNFVDDYYRSLAERSK